MGQKRWAVLTKVFYKKMYGRFAGRQTKTGRNNEVTVKRGSTVKGTSWMLSANGLDRYMMRKCLQIPASTIKWKLDNFPKTFINLLPGYEAIFNYLIGDPAYPWTPFCMKEYQTCATNEEVVFNSMLRSARNQVECAFGRLKVRWGFLTRKVDLKLEMVPTVTYSCFVLHSYRESKGNSPDD